MRDEFILSNIGLVYKAIKDLHCYCPNEDDFEEYYFAGIIGLIYASDNYDPSKGKSGFILSCVKNEILKTFIKRSAMKRQRNDVSANKIINDTELQNLIASDYNLEKEAINNIYIEQIYELANKLKGKNAKEYFIEYYKEEKTMEDIAQKYGVTRQLVFMSIKNSIKKIRKELE
jgi:RNA polymerase sigma factor (sigma-70 family)